MRHFGPQVLSLLWLWTPSSMLSPLPSIIFHCSSEGQINFLLSHVLTVNRSPRPFLLCDLGNFSKLLLVLPFWWRVLLLVSAYRIYQFYYPLYLVFIDQFTCTQISLIATWLLKSRLVGYLASFPFLHNHFLSLLHLGHTLEAGSFHVSHDFSHPQVIWSITSFCKLWHLLHMKIWNGEISCQGRW